LCKMRLALCVAALLVVQANAFYLPGVAPREFQDGEKVTGPSRHVVDVKCFV
jgi:hypothetical protein